MQCSYKNNNNKTHTHTKQKHVQCRVVTDKHVQCNVAKNNQILHLQPIRAGVDLSLPASNHISQTIRKAMPIISHALTHRRTHERTHTHTHTHTHTSLAGSAAEY